MGHSWYLSTDMQIHIFSPLVLIPLFYSKIAGGVSVALFFILSIASCYAVHFKYDFPATLFTYLIYGDAQSNGTNDYMMFLYAAPWVRCTPYIIGVLTGYFLHKTKGKKLTIHPLVAITLWCASVAVGLACVLGLYNNIKGIPISTAAAASYDNFSRIGWALALAWVVIACQNNVAGPIKNFMELGMWAPVSRLTFCAYLMHFFVVLVFMAQTRQPIHFVTAMSMFLHYALPCFVITYFFSFFWSCGFEVSFGKLEKMGIAALTGGERRRPHNEEDDRRQQTLSTDDLSQTQKNHV
uniref:Nose resistant to fluoxetine protein 6 n=1 Tax=Ascaris suum TaxID=6253 RepID=F1L7Z0_ASCSU